METYMKYASDRTAGNKRNEKIEDFVIVIDTSMSCNGSLIRRFLEETYSVLSRVGEFFP